VNSRAGMRANLSSLPAAELNGGPTNRNVINTEFCNLRHFRHVSVANLCTYSDEFYGERIDFDPAWCSEFVREIIPQRLCRFKGAHDAICRDVLGTMCVVGPHAGRFRAGTLSGL